MAEAALHDLPDTIDREDVAAWGGKWNIDMDYDHRPDGRQPITEYAAAPTYQKCLAEQALPLPPGA